MGDSATAALGSAEFVRACLPLSSHRLFTWNLFPSSLPPVGKKATQDEAAEAAGAAETEAPQLY